MDSILGHQHFVSETANLFSDEKTAHAREKVITWMNELGLVAPSVKCELLVKIQETILGACPELLEEFFVSILALAHDSNMDVRKQVVGFIEQICKQKVELLPQIIGVVSMLVRDRSPQVIKRTIQACGSIYKNGLQWICSHTELTDSVEQAWSVLSLVKAQILDLIDNENDGIRTNAIKFLEGVVVLQSYPDEDSHKKDNDFSLEDMPVNLKIIKRNKLEEEALNIFDILLKFHAATHISSVNLITCTGSLCTIAKLRPSLMGPVVEAFKLLNSNLPPTLTDSQVNSVRKFAKMQLIGLLKNRGSFEFQATIRQLLLDLGASQSEIQRSIPKMDKQEQMRRQKRILENAANSVTKRLRMDNNDTDQDKPMMEVDDEELRKQFQKCARVNEKFIAEHLRISNTVVALVLEFLPQLPDEVPPYFLEEYSPIRDMSTQQQVNNISKILGENMASLKIGPGAAALTKDPPMRPIKIQKVLEAMSIDDNSNDSRDQNLTVVNEEQLRKEEATKKLRENMERIKGEQELIERMKARAKTLKLQEVTKPFSRITKEKFLLDSVKRMLNSERQCVIGGVSAKRRKILSVMAATFPEKVRYFIFDFIMLDIKQRIDLAFTWLYEEYCLLQGYTRHSYVKSENRPDFAYNELLSKLISGITENCEFKEKISLLRRIFINAPLLPDDAIEELVKLCFNEELTQHCLELIKDLTILRPPRKSKFIQILLTFCVHARADLRDRALEHIVSLYHVHKISTQRIEEFAIEWITYLENEIPPVKIFSNDYGRSDVELTWREETTRICLILLLTLLPFQSQLLVEKLFNVYSNTSADIKRTILRSIDSAIKKLGAENPVLLKFIEDCPKGCETLVIRIVYILTERAPTASPELVNRVRDLYANKVKDVRVLVPVLSGLTKQEIMNALPKMLKLNHAVVKEIFSRLLGSSPEFAHQTIAATPTDILVALHSIDLSQCDLKLIVKATSLCLAEKEIYTQEVLIGVLQQLIDIVPIPTLLMRTIIQSLTLYPKLTNFVLSLQQRLILKQVWRQKVIWEGFLKCLQRLKPQSLPVMLHLPGPHLMSALQQCPDLREPLREYAESIRDEPMSGITPQIMDIISGKAVDVFVTDESGGYITVDNIKKEVEDVELPIVSIVPVLASVPAPVPTSIKAAVADATQPLPPGED